MARDTDELIEQGLVTYPPKPTTYEEWAESVAHHDVMPRFGTEQLIEVNSGPPISVYEALRKTFHEAHEIGRQAGLREAGMTKASPASA